MKKLAKLKGAKVLKKEQQLTIQGGAGPGANCDSICVNGAYGRRCNVHAGCPDILDGMCDGNGGWWYL